VSLPPSPGLSGSEFPEARPRRATALASAGYSIPHRTISNKFAAFSRIAITLFGLWVISTGVSGQDSFDKNSFLSRKKWYLSYTLRIKGVDGITKVSRSGDSYTRLDYNILREVSGVMELGEVLPGQFPSSHIPKDPKEIMAYVSEKGRFIGWKIASNVSSQRPPVSSAAPKFAGDPRYLAGLYSITDSLVTEALTLGEARSFTKLAGSTKIKGAGTAFVRREGLFLCDLKEMHFDLMLGSMCAAAGGFNGDVANVNTWRVNHSFEESLGTDEIREYPLKTDKPDHFLPALTETLRQQLLWRKLELRGEKIAFTVSEPITKFPWGIDQAKKGGKPLELSIEVVISPTPPSEMKMILVPRDYDKWRPLCSDSEDKPGNAFGLDWRVEEKGGNPAQPTRVARVSFSLINTSKLPGVCMNYPIVPNSAADYDLKFDQTKTLPGYHVTSDGQKLTLSMNEVSARKGTLSVDCFDSGATASLVAEAELEDGRVLTAVVEKSEEPQLMIPDFELGVSRIARSWRAKNAPGKSDDADDENIPVGDGQKGDGLTVWEEYRGFWSGGKWDGYCDPLTKDLFVLNEIGGRATHGIELFGSTTGVHIHDNLVEGEIKKDRVMNFNRGGQPHLVDQHCIIISDGGYYGIGDDGATSEASICNATDGTNFPGPPKNTFSVSILSSMLDAIVPLEQVRNGETYFVAGADLTVAHELAHGVGIRHHGDKDLGARPWYYKRLSTGQLITYADGVEVTIRQESTGDIMVPQQLFYKKEPGLIMNVWMGERNGQHAGDEACIMRYDIAVAYRSQSYPDVIYFHGGPEIRGVRLCSSQAGTGVNLPTHDPQPRYFAADKDRGDCIHKFVISDRWEKIH
jgi:hypothetical protein